MISVLQSSLCTGEMVSTALSMSSTEGAFIVSKNTSEGVGVSNPGVPGPTSKLSPRAPAQMGRRETEREGGRSRRETGVRGGIPRPSCLSRAQVGCACSRGLQASTREGASGLTRAPSRPSPRGQPSVRGPWSFLL
jgi:hypothetical protein